MSSPTMTDATACLRTQHKLSHQVNTKPVVAKENAYSGFCWHTQQNLASQIATTIFPPS